MARLFVFTLFAIACLLIVQRQKFQQRVISYIPAPAPRDINQQTIKDPNNYYRIGKYDISLAPVPKLTLQNPLAALDILTRKKINSYIFVQYNLYKLQLNFIDLGYTSMVQINYWTHDTGHQSITQKIGFSLPQDFNQPSLNLDIIKQKFKLHVRQIQRIGRSGQTQTATTFNITLNQKSTQLDVNYTHIRRDDQCATIVRNGVVSLKCFGGYGYGRVRLNYLFFDHQDGQNKKKMSTYNPKTNQTKCAFDGFRGNGWDWKWMWMYAHGFSKPQFYADDHTVDKQEWIGFNFGSLYGKSQDFLFLNGKIYPIEGAKYKIHQSLPEKKNMTITATNPQMKINFQIMDRTVIYDDMGLLKNDMVKGQGHFVGYVIDPQNKQHKVDFYQMSGMVQIANSFF